MTCQGLVPPDPANRHAVYHAVDLNFRLKPASKAVDTGVVIPTVNNDFTGRAGPRRAGSRKARAQVRATVADIAAVLPIVAKLTSPSNVMQPSTVPQRNDTRSNLESYAFFDLRGDGSQDAKKNGMTKRKIEYWVIPPDQDAEFVADMENVLETYAEAYDPQQPVLCMDEQPVQLLKETKVPIAATSKHAERVDYEYERNGTASIFMFAEPLSGFRQATAREHRTKVDWAIEVAQLLDTRYAACAKVTLVCDNLNTHTKGAFYTAFPPEQARGYIKRMIKSGELAMNRRNFLRSCAASGLAGLTTGAA